MLIISLTLPVIMVGHIEMSPPPSPGLQINGETLKGRSKAIFKGIMLDNEECWHMMNEIIGLFPGLSIFFISFRGVSTTVR